MKRGRSEWAAVLGLLFSNAFWNGIVAVFVLSLCGAMPDNEPPQGGEWWGLFFFLIPFEVIGLCMFLGLLAVLLEPVHRTIWHFTRRDAERRAIWLGVGPRRTWEVASLDRVDLCRDAKRWWHASLPGGDGRRYRLSLVDKTNTELCSVNGLTEGEARWIGDAILRERAIWFR